MSQLLQQWRLHCPCGRAKILARGLCATCYTLQRQDRAYFGGLREKILTRDGHRCRGCGAAGRGKRTLAVHHRRPGVSTLASLITLCPGCHARVSRTCVLRNDWPELLRLLWREQHPHAHEQGRLDFAATVGMPAPEAGELFAGMGDRCQGRDRR
jgi:hypothetical protein